MSNPTEGQPVVVVTVHREPSGDYWSEVNGDDALVCVLVQEGEETVYANDAAIERESVGL